MGRDDLFSDTIATGNKGTSFEYFVQRYRDIFARSRVDLKVRETDGALDNIELLKNPHAGVQIALVFGGISDGVAREVLDEMHHT